MTSTMRLVSSGTRRDDGATVVTTESATSTADVGQTEAVPVGGSALVLHITGTRPTAEQMAAMTVRAQNGDTLTVSMLDQLGARDALTAWAAAGCPIVGE